MFDNVAYATYYLTAACNLFAAHATYFIIMSHCSLFLSFFGCACGIGQDKVLFPFYFSPFWDLFSFSLEWAEWAGWESKFWNMNAFELWELWLKGPPIKGTHLKEAFFTMSMLGIRWHKQVAMITILLTHEPNITYSSSLFNAQN